MPELSQVLDERMPMVCSACAAPLRQGARFCGRCGTPVQVDAAAARQVDTRVDTQVDAGPPVDVSATVPEVDARQGMSASIPEVTPRQEMSASVPSEPLAPARDRVSADQSAVHSGDGTPAGQSAVHSGERTPAGQSVVHPGERTPAGHNVVRPRDPASAVQAPQRAPLPHTPMTESSVHILGVSLIPSRHGDHHDVVCVWEVDNPGDDDWHWVEARGFLLDADHRPLAHCRVAIEQQVPRGERLLGECVFDLTAEQGDAVVPGSVQVMLRLTACRIVRCALAEPRIPAMSSGRMANPHPWLRAIGGSLLLRTDSDGMATTLEGRCLLQNLSDRRLPLVRLILTPTETTDPTLGQSALPIVGARALDTGSMEMLVARGPLTRSRLASGRGVPICGWPGQWRMPRRRRS